MGAVSATRGTVPADRAMERLLTARRGHAEDPRRTGAAGQGDRRRTVVHLQRGTVTTL
ncbi:hypothetical protein Q760_10645 [Cellulomonas cellasea DSM 20118]|uniref:Uncharacterized protein n=1 Tax=Cellulomonas cellasea DSM 20118 TaxID=1408250 RepID=A0A0A0B9Y7_9CELL|nr:hypothetical protein Q760_10645 [Cellulomonas cellasea DSM 20118]